MEYTSFATKEIKLSADSADGSFSGYGAVFGNMDSYGDVIVPGAFGETLAESKQSNIMPAMLLQHGGFTSEDNTPIGVWTSMVEDGVGLFVEGKLAIKTQRGNDVYELLKMGAISGMSIGYQAKSYEPRTRPEEPRRKLTKIDLYEVSLVTFPANSKARISAVKSEPSIRDAERALRDAGFSREEAKSIVACGFKKTPLRDAGAKQEVVDGIRHLIQTLSPGGKNV